MSIERIHNKLSTFELVDIFQIYVINKKNKSV